MISRFKPSCWIAAFSQDPSVCSGLVFSYGVYPVQISEEPGNWRDFSKAWLGEHQVPGSVALLVAGPSDRNPDANHRLEFMRVADK
jgi:pyruvate kinase